MKHDLSVSSLFSIFRPSNVEAAPMTLKSNVILMGAREPK